MDTSILTVSLYCLLKETNNNSKRVKKHKNSKKKFLKRNKEKGVVKGILNKNNKSEG